MCDGATSALLKKRNQPRLEAANVKYTTLDELNRRLDGRLKIGGIVSSLGETSITADLVVQVADQIEGLIDGILRMRYQLPLVNAHPFLSGIVEKGVACQLLSQYFVGQGPSESTPSDGFVCSDYRRDLKMLEMIALDGEILIDPETNRQGFSWGSIQSGPRTLPNQTVNW
jgi:phage gp36-like protein